METRPLWNHQVQGIRRAETQPDLGLLFEQGTGKTRTLIEILRRRFAAAGRMRKTLILCPVLVLENWKDEIKRYSKIPGKEVVILYGAAKKRERDFVAAVGDTMTGNKIIITNYEAMQMDGLYAMLMHWHPEIMVCDESQRVKNPQSVRAKKVAGLADLTEHNYILTGTPILDGKGMDAFMQFRILDRGLTFGKNYFAFRNRFFYDKNAGMNKINYFPNWQPHPATYQEFQDLIRKQALRVLKKDCLDLPPFVRQVVHCELSQEQRKAYKEMYNDYITFIESQKDQPRAVVAQLAVTKSLRLQQIVTGYAMAEDGTVHRYDNPRLKVLAELLQDIVLDGGHKVIVWAVFKENYRMIEDLLKSMGIQYRMLTGDTPQAERVTNMRDFREDPGVSVMLANQAAGGVGVNLVEASYAIYYSKGFKLEDDLQSEARNYRGGSEMHTSVTRIDIVAPGTIDELITKALADKQQVSEQILGWKEKLNYGMAGQ